MATQEQLAALEQILDIAKQAGLNNNEEHKSIVHNADEFNKKIVEICVNNVLSTFLVFCVNNIDSNSISKSSAIIGSQLSNNIVSSIQCVSTNQFSKYNALIYRLNSNKTAIIIILNDEEYANKNEKIQIIRNITSETQQMIIGSCGEHSISFAVSSRKNNEKSDSFISRTHLLLNKNTNIAYDSHYFGAGIEYNNDNNAAFNIRGNEIITLCIGGSGTNIGNEWFQTMMNEHQIDPKTGLFGGKKDTLLDKINTYFDLKQNRYHPRSLFIDLDSDNLNKIKNGILGQLIDIDIGTQTDINISHYWPQGHYTNGKQLFDDAVGDKIRGMAERCDNMQGFNLLHSINGGIGGGLTTLIQSALKEDYSSKICANFCVFPDDKSDILSNYNSVLSLSSLSNCSDLLFPISNLSLRNIISKRLNLDGNNTVFADYNWLISLVLCGITAPFRFYGEPQISSSLQKMYYEFGIFSGAVHLTMAHAPFINKSSKRDCAESELSAAQIKEHLISKINNISSSPNNDMIKNGKILQHTVIYKCNDQNMNIYRDLNEKLRHLSNELMDYKWICDPMPFQSSVIYDQCAFYDEYAPIISSAIVHSTAISKEYKNIQSGFKTNFKQKQLLSSFYDKGMDSYEFIEAEKSIDALITKYKKLENRKVVDNDDDDDEKDDYDEDEEEEEEEF